MMIMTNPLRISMDAIRCLVGVRVCMGRVIPQNNYFTKINKTIYGSVSRQE
jgi:hypothetical protein